MSDENSAPELIAPVSGVVLSLMAHLRHSTLPSGEALESLPSRTAMASGWLDDGKLILAFRDCSNERKSYLARVHCGWISQSQCSCLLSSSSFPRGTKGVLTARELVVLETSTNVCNFDNY